MIVIDRLSGGQACIMDKGTVSNRGLLFNQMRSFHFLQNIIVDRECVDDGI